jgi:hypothetical protein
VLNGLITAKVLEPNPKLAVATPKDMLALELKEGASLGEPVLLRSLR